MVEIGLTLDHKDFLPNGYHVDEEKYPKTAAKKAGKKDKALASSLQQETEVVEEEEAENVAKEENCIDLSDDEIGAPVGSEPPLSGAHLTFPDADREVLLHKKNVMTPWTLFSDNVVVERAELPPPSPTIETRLTKRAKQSRLASGTEASSSLVADDSISTKLLALEKWVQRMTKSNFTIQASLQQSLADQARENHKMMQHQKKMAESQKEFMKITRDSMKDMFSNLRTMVMSIVQKVQTMNPTPLNCVDP